MRVLIVSQYFPPETGAARNRIESISTRLAEGGHEVDVITAKPNYPTGKISSDYHGGLFKLKTYRGINVIHTWIFEDHTKRFLSRMMYFISFMVMSVMASFKLKSEYDVVLASSPPLLVGLSGWVISRLKNARFVFDVRDLWPGVAVAMGELANPAMINMAEKLETFLYKRSDLITTVTESFADHIKPLSENENKVHVVMNGAFTDHFDQQFDVGEFRKHHLFGDQFTITYAGNIGLAQGLDHVCEAARKLNSEGSTVRIAIIGDGPRKKHLKDLCEHYQLNNIELIPRINPEIAVKYLLASDAVLVPLADDEIYKMFIPSKLFDGMSAGKPVLLSVDGEARSILEDCGAGLFYRPESAEQLAKSITYLRNNPDEAKKMGENGFKYARERYSRDKQARLMEKLLYEVSSR